MGRRNKASLERRRDPLVSNPIVTRAARYGILAWAAIGVALLAYIAFRYLLYPIRIVFPPLALAVVLVFLFNPIVSMLERCRVRRALARPEGAPCGGGGAGGEDRQRAGRVLPGAAPRRPVRGRRLDGRAVPHRAALLGRGRADRRPVQPGPADRAVHRRGPGAFHR